MKIKKIFAAILTAALMLSVFAIPVAAEKDKNRTSVDHIDIGVSLTAKITLDGEESTQTYTLTKADVQSDNFTITSSAAFTADKEDISESSGSSGIKQYRISGDYPVGTITAPINYTVTLKKTVTVEDVEIPVTFSSTFNYWTAGNDCPGLDGHKDSWKAGEIVDGSGLDFILGNASGEATTVTSGVIHIQKTVAVAELEEAKTFAFNIYTADGKLYKTVEASVAAGGTVAITSLDNVPFGSYYVVEDIEGLEIEGYTLTSTTYQPTGTSASAAIKLSADAPDANFIVTNTYEAVKEESSTPTEESSTPVEESSKPVEESSKPVEESSTPVEESSKPVEESSKPVEESKPEEEIIIPDVPKTGTTAGLWIALGSLSGSGLIAMTALKKKKD